MLWPHCDRNDAVTPEKQALDVQIGREKINNINNSNCNLGLIHPVCLRSSCLGAIWGMEGSTLLFEHHDTMRSQ